MRKLLLITFMFATSFAINAQDLSNATNQCNRLFGDNNVTCIEFVNQAQAINEKDARMNTLHDRILTLISQVNANLDNPDWIRNIEHSIVVADAEYSTLMLNLHSFINNTVIPLEDELITLNTENDSDWDALITLTSTYKGDFRLDWDAIGADLALLQADFNVAKNNLGIISSDDQPQILNDFDENDTVDENTLEEFIPNPIDAVAIATETCVTLIDTDQYNQCLFREAWVTMEARNYCIEENMDLCEFAQDSYRDRKSDADWEELFELYSVDDDPYASIAVAKCQLFPSLDENGDEIGLAACAEAEYIGLTTALENSNDDTDDSDTEEQNSQVGIITDDFIQPLVGTWCNREAENCLQSQDLFGFVDADGIHPPSFSFVIPRIAPDVYQYLGFVYDEDEIIDITIEVLSETEGTLTLYFHSDGSTSTGRWQYDG